MQELLAPGEVIFCDQCWHTIGRKKDYGFCKTIAATTGIPLLHLLDHLTLSFASVAQKLSWASKRVTTKDEDLAYSLLGLCDVNMPLLYGEKGKAFLRLQEEIIKQSDDESIFAWTRVSTSASTADWLGMYNDIPVLAEHPRDFERSQNVRRSDKIIRQPYSITNKGLLFVADAAYNGLMKIYIIRLNAEIRPAVDNGVGSSDYGTTSCLIAVKEKADRSFGRVGCNSLDLSNWNGSRTMIDRLIPSGLHHVKEKRFLIETRWYHNRYERGRGPRAAKGDQLQCVVDQANAST